MSNFFLSHPASQNKSLGELIKKIRTTNNLTQAAFGKLFEPSVSQSTIARWEKGIQTPDRIHFPKIASLLDISFEELLEIVEEPLFNEDDFYPDIENKTMTHNKRHLAMLKKGVRAWNKWREKNPHVIPQLSGIDISLGKYSELDGYNLNDANLAGFEGRVVSFNRASLRGANLEKANLGECDFEEADLTEANLKQININDSNLNRVILIKANLSEASIRHSTLIMANLEESEIDKAKFVGLNLSNAILKKAKISNTELININFAEANFNEASLEKTIFQECSVYGVSFLSASLKEIENKGIYVSPKENKGLAIDDLTLSPYIYLQRHNRSEIEKFINKFNLEKEIIKLGSILCDKYGNYSHTKNFCIFNNINHANSHPPYIDVRRDNGSFSIDFRPDYSDIKLVLAGKAQLRRILQIVDGVIESNFSFDDVDCLQKEVIFNQEIQNNRVNQFVPIALKILELTKKDKVVFCDYILERVNKEIVLYDNSDLRIELLRIANSKDRYEVIRSSLKDNHINFLQKALDDIQISL